MRDFEKEILDLNSQLKKLEGEREAFSRLMTKSKEICDQQGESAMRRFYIMDEMRLHNKSPELMKVLNYNHEVMSSMKKKNEQLYLDFDETYRKKQRHWSMCEEDIYLELQRLHQEQDENIK